MSEVSYLAGLDLGQVNEYTALAILERTRLAEPTNQSGETCRVTRNWDGQSTVPVREATLRPEKTYAVRHLERFSLGTPSR